MGPGSRPGRRWNFLRGYAGGQKRYLAECTPEQQADIVIDYNDMQTPKILRWNV